MIRHSRETAAIVLAAGHGRRMHTAVAKQFLLLNGKPLLYYALKAFEDSGIGRIVLVTGEEEIPYCRAEIVEKYALRGVTDIVAGGKERYHSVYAGLCALESVFPADGIVLIHDGARPLVDAGTISRTIEGAEEFGAAVAAVPVKDTIKAADAEEFAQTTLDRSALRQMQTPQTFRYDLVKAAYDRLFTDPAYEKGITDDAMVVETMLGHRVKLTEGSYRNLKVTTPEDLVIAEAFLRERG